MVNKRTPPADQGRAKKEADHSLWRYICTLLNDDFASIGQVERHTGLSHTSIQRIHDGHTNLRQENMDKLADAFDKTTADFMVGWSHFRTTGRLAPAPAPPPPPPRSKPAERGLFHAYLSTTYNRR